MADYKVKITQEMIIVGIDSIEQLSQAVEAELMANLVSDQGVDYEWFEIEEEEDDE